MARRHAIALAAFTLGAFGCGGAPAPRSQPLTPAGAPPPGSGSISASAPAVVRAPIALPPATDGVLAPGAADAILPAGAPAIVTLLDPGAAPRGAVVYAFPTGTKQRMTMAIDISMAVGVMGNAAPARVIPRMNMMLDLAATDRSSAGDFAVAGRLVGTSLDPRDAGQQQLAQSLTPQLHALEGLAMTYWVTPKGRVHDVKLAIPDSAPAAARQLMEGMSQSFDSMAMPLPDEAIGVGARWQVISRIAAGGADLLQSAMYTLTARAGTRITLDVALTQLSAGNTIRSPQMPAAMSANVTVFHSKGGGVTHLDLARIAPDHGEMAIKSEISLNVVGGGGSGASASTATVTTDTAVVMDGADRTTTPSP